MPRGRRGRPAGALYGHCQRVYGALNAEALNLADAPEDVRALVPEQTGRVWLGTLTTRMERLGYGSYYYSTIRGALLAMGCVLQVRRGVHHRPGVWLLLAPPTEQRYRERLGKPLESRESEHQARHDLVIGRWLQVAGRHHPALLQEAMDAGNETVGELLVWLAALPEHRRRTLPPCLGFRGAETHTCLVPSLDVLADTSAGSQVRRRDHLAKLAAGE
jgi:hypothetical protein